MLHLLFSLQVCPICSVKVTRDMLSHITLQHGHLFKISFLLNSLISLFLSVWRWNIVFLIIAWLNIYVQPELFYKFPLTEDHMQRRRRLRRVAVPNSQALSLLGRDLREAHLQVLLGGGGYRSNNASVSNAATDPFLSSLILNFPTSEGEEISKSVVTSADDTSAKNEAPTHIWKSRYLFQVSYVMLERSFSIIASSASCCVLICLIEMH